MPRMEEPSPPKAGPGSAFPSGGTVQGKKKRRVKKKAKRVAILPQQQQEDELEFSSLAWTDTTEDLLTLLMPSAASTNTATTATTTTNTTTANVVSTVKKKKKKKNEKKRVNFFEDSDSSNSSSSIHDKTDSPPKRSPVPLRQLAKHKKPFPSIIPATKAAKTAASAKKNATKRQLQREPSYSDLLSSPSVKERMRSLPSAKKEAVVPPVLTPTKAAASQQQQQQQQQQQRRATVTIQQAKPKKASQTSKKATTTKTKGASTARAGVVKTNCSTEAASTKAPSVSTNSATGSTSSLLALQPPQRIVPAPTTHNRCAIAIDTRFIDTLLGQEFGADWIDECDAFLESLSSRGAHPHILTCSARKEKATTHTSRKRYSLTAQVVAREQQNVHNNNDIDDDDLDPQTKEQDDMHRVTPAWIPPPPNMDNTDRKAVKVPKHLLANESWTHFGELVEKIIEEDAKTKPTTASGTAKKRRPLDVTIVSNDVSLFCDIKDASHKRAFSRFWDLIKPYFQFEDLLSIHIVILKTGTIAMAKPMNENDSDNTATATDTPESNKENTEAMDASMEHSDDFLLQRMEQENQANAEDEARSLHEMGIAKCVRSLQAQLRDAAEKDYKLSLNAKNHTPQVDISISMIDATANVRLAFKDLVRRSLRDIVTNTSAVVKSAAIMQNNSAASSTANRIHLQLPETIDGTQCSVTLDISYKLLPFALDRPVISEGFFCDLAELCASTLKVVQLVPFSSVDATFLFGVPMRVRAGVEGDYEQYQEAQVLTRSLFKTMQTKQVAMLIQIADDSQNEKRKQSDNTNSMLGVFHNPKRGQTFLLMAEEPVGGLSPPSTGVLFRYASADDLLLETEPPATKIEIPDEIVHQYESYVENALDILDCNAVNPLFLDATDAATAKTAKDKWTTPRLPPRSSQQSNDDNRWNDDEGVGALDKTGVGFLRTIGGETLSVEDDDDDDDDDDYQGFNSFLYSQQD